MRAGGDAEEQGMGDEGEDGTRPRDHAAGGASPSAGRFGALIEHSMDLVSIYDAEGRFSFASPSHRWLLGHDPDELVGSSPIELLHPEDRDAVAHAFEQQLLGTGIPVPVEHRIRHTDGSWRW